MLIKIVVSKYTKYTFTEIVFISIQQRWRWLQICSFKDSYFPKQKRIQYVMNVQQLATYWKLGLLTSLYLIALLFIMKCDF